MSPIEPPGMRSADGPALRLAELVAALSLATDLGMGQPMEHALRTCLLALGLGERLGLNEDELAGLYYVALLRRAGCTADSYELGRVFGDDLAAHGRVFFLDFSRLLDVFVDVVHHAGAGRSPAARVRAIAEALLAGTTGLGAVFRASCEVAQGLAAQLELSPAIRHALGHTFERWDGRGFPHRLAGEEIALAARVVQVAEDAEVFCRLGGAEAAAAMARQRAGAHHDPAIAGLFAREAQRLGAAMERGATWEAVLAAEPGARPTLSAARLDNALQAMAQFADLKSPFATGHSAGVAGLAAAAAVQAGLPDMDVVAVRRAALVHDLGRVAVPNSIWDKPGPLTESEWERVRLHPYYTERALARSPALARLGSLARLHHERLDGSGYHRGVPASLLPAPARILSAADMYHAIGEPRPHRAAMTHDDAERALRQEVRSGRLDGDAVDAVLRAAGHRVRRRREWPARLTAREVEVLRLLARGLSNRAIARRLVISEPTVASHVRHVYDKIGVTTRAGATLFAMQHALLEGPAVEGSEEPAEPAERSSV